MDIELVEAVITEAKNLVKYATKKERSNLNFNSLSHYSPMQCIYGQMTGYCYNERSVKLLKKCAVKWSKNIHPTSRAIKVGRGTPLDDRGRASRYYSAIEYYIGRRDNNNNNLVNYLKTGNEEFLNNL